MKPNPATIFLRHDLLIRLYKAHQEFLPTGRFACRRFCCQCCSPNVTITTLEGYHILAGLEKAERIRLLSTLLTESPTRRFQPSMTTNQLAAVCLKGEDPPDEEAPPTEDACVLLKKSLCPIYRLRPFGCRCMVSNRTCQPGGAADMDPFVLTVNTVFLQYIEHLDRPGGFGNLADVLFWLSADSNLEKYRAGDFACQTGSSLIANHPIPALMIPPEYRRKMKPLFETFQKIASETSVGG